MGHRALPIFLALAGIFIVNSPAQAEPYYLDFFPDAPHIDLIDVHPYSAAEMDMVLDGMTAMFAPFPDIAFTLTEPNLPHSPVRFNTTAIGTSTGVDFRNIASIDVASVNALKGLAFAGVGGPTPTEIVKASINLAAHEVGHLEGLRHHDAFTPIGGGMSSGSLAADYLPVYPGPISATLTGTDVQSLTTSFGGFSAAALTGDLLIGQRSAIKLAMNGDMNFFTESALSSPHDSFATAAPLPLKTIAVPNVTMPGDAIFGLDVFADVIAVAGEIEISTTTGTPEADYYAFTALAGDLVQAEALSEIIESRLTEMDVNLAVFDASDLGTPIYYGDSLSKDEKESSDSLILDLVIPHTGAYIIEVFGEPGPAALGDYELFVSVVRAVAIPVPAGAMLGVVGLSVVGLRRRVG